MEPGESEQSHAWESAQTGLDLEFDLVLEEAGMLHHLVIEDEGVGEGCDEEVEAEYSDEGDHGEGEELAGDVVARPRAEETRWQLVELGRTGRRRGCCEDVGMEWWMGDGRNKVGPLGTGRRDEGRSVNGREWIVVHKGRNWENIGPYFVEKKIVADAEDEVHG